MSVFPLPAGEVLWAGVGQSNVFRVRVDDPQTVSGYLRYVSLYVEFGTLSGVVSYKRTLPADPYEAEFNITEVISGAWNDFTLRNNLPEEHFVFPADPDYPAINNSSLLIEGYFNAEYSWVTPTSGVISHAKTNNSSNSDYHFKVFNGGASRSMQAYLQRNATDLFSFFTAVNNRKFLTWMPNNLKIHPRQPLRLYLLNPSGTELYLKSTIYYTDGTNSTHVIGPAANGYLIEAAVGIKELRLGNYNIVKKIEKYEVYMATVDESFITEKRTFIPDYVEYERNDVFFFMNSLGVYDVLWCHGFASEKVSMSKSESVLPLLPPATRNHSIASKKGVIDLTRDLSIGHFTKTHRFWLLDFLNSDRVFYPAGYDIHPIVVEPNNNTPMGEDRQDLFDLSFSYKPASQDVFYSDTPVSASPFGDFNDDFNQDFFIS